MTAQDNKALVNRIFEEIWNQGITILRIVGGKIAESWGNSDTLGMMQQLGVLPAPEKVS